MFPNNSFHIPGRMDFDSKKRHPYWDSLLHNPSTWLLIRIFAVIRLVVAFDFYSLVLLIDVARTILLNNERSSAGCQTDPLEDHPSSGQATQTEESPPRLTDGECQTETPADFIEEHTIIHDTGDADSVDSFPISSSDSLPTSVDSGIQTDPEETGACGVQTVLLGVAQYELDCKLPIEEVVRRRGPSDVEFAVNEDLSAEIDLLKAGLADKEEHVMMLQTAAMALRMKNEALVLTVETDRKEMDSLRGDMEILQEQVDVYERSIDEDREDMEKLETLLKESHHSCSEKECKIEDLCEEIELWKTKLDTMCGELDKMKESTITNTSRLLQRSVLNRSTRERATSPESLDSSFFLSPSVSASVEKYSVATETEPPPPVEMMSVGTATDVEEKVSLVPAPVAPVRIPELKKEQEIPSSAIKSASLLRLHEKKKELGVLYSGQKFGGSLILLPERGTDAVMLSSGRKQISSAMRLPETRKEPDSLSSGMKDGSARKKVQFYSVQDVRTLDPVAVSLEQGPFPIVPSEFGMRRPLSRIPQTPGIRRTTQQKPATPVSTFQYRTKEFSFQPTIVPQSAIRKSINPYLNRTSQANGPIPPECQNQ